MVRTQAHRATPAGYGPTGSQGIRPGASSRHEAAPAVVAGGAAADWVAAVNLDEEADELQRFRIKGGMMKGMHPPCKGCGMPASSPDADPMAGARRGCGGHAFSRAADLLAGKGVAGGYGSAGTQGTGGKSGGGVAAGCAGSLALTPSGQGVAVGNY